MADPRNLPKGRGPGSDANDEAYKIPVTRHYKTLIENNYDSHLQLGRSIRPEKCPVLASRLLKPDERDAALNKDGVQYLGLEVLNVWMEKQGSTIWVLKDTLEKMQLWDTLALLEKARFDYVPLYIMIFEAGEETSEPLIKQMKTVPGAKPLVDVVRPIIYRKQGLKLAQREKILDLRLVRSSDGDQEMIWNSPARNFKGEQVDIQLSYTDALNKRRTDPGRKVEGVTPVDRNVISWIDEGSLCFGYADAEPATFERLAHPVQEMGKVLDQPMKELSLKSDLSLEDHGTKVVPEVEDWSDCPGFCISVDPATEDTLLEHLTNDGDYVIQQTQVSGQKNLKLSVRQGERVFQYPIVTQVNREKCYLIEGGDHFDSSLPQLIDFYRTNSLHPLMPTPAAAAEDSITPIYLKNPVSNVN